MRTSPLFLAIMLLAIRPTHAEELQFWLNRFGGIFLNTTTRHVRIFQGNKTGEETIFEADLKETAPGIFCSHGGTLFILKRLNKPAINDGNRKINSGNWNLKMCGSKEFKALVPKLPFTAFGDSKDGWFGGRAD
jgi:hypothetical protein